MNSNTWLLLESGVCDAAFNMALDEALLEAMPSLRKPLLRFYGWTTAAASFGYFQKYADAARATALRPLVRRPTGGGLVPHDGDWTYSLVFPADNEWYRTRAVESYRRAHEWIQAAFATLGVTTELADRQRQAGSGRCFAGCEKFDVLWQGKKIAGAAQRRTRRGLLVQGSVQPPLPRLSRTEWQTAMRDRAPGSEAEWTPFVADSELIRRASELAAGKYSTDSFLRKR